MWKEYREAFDEVRASDRLRMEVMNMREQNARRRKIPTAVLVAAALVVVLAGTAVASEVLGIAQVDFLDLQSINQSLESQEGYFAHGDVALFSRASLSEAVLERTADTDGSHEVWDLGSWSEAEDYLGLELADNPKLAQMTAADHGMQLGENRPMVRGHCLALVSYNMAKGKWFPASIELSSAYQADSCMIYEDATLHIDYPGREEIEIPGPGLMKPLPEDGEVSTETYLTPSGLEVTIVTETGNWNGSAYTSYDAYFVLNNIFFRLNTSVGKTHYYMDADLALSTLKEVLDAYQ